MALIAFAYETAKIWINPNQVRVVTQSGKYAIVHFDDQHTQLLTGDADEITSKLNKAME